MLKKNKEMVDELDSSKPGEGSEEAASREDLEKINLIALVAEQQMALADYKERYKQRKKRCAEMEELAESRQARANYY